MHNGATKSMRPSPAIVVAVLALVAAATGVATAEPATQSAVTKKKVKKIADKEIKRLAPGLSVANSAALDGKPASAYASSDVEPYHEVGQPGEPPFESGWSNWGGAASTTAFYKDPLGVVHLKGTLSATPDATVAFTLPPGYRPSQFLTIPIGAAGGGLAGISPTGTVNLDCNGGGSCGPGTIDGITFRAG